jgi:outer membrane protein
MKHLGILIVVLLLSQASFAQKIGYVDTNFVLDKMEEYKEAQTEIDKVAGDWQKEIEEMLKEVADLSLALQTEDVLLTAELKAQRKDEIAKKEEEAKEYQHRVFGPEGLYFLKKQELMAPILDEVFAAIERVCKSKRLAIMFDKASDINMIYTDPRHDYTDFVLEELGLGDDDDTIQND